MCIALLAAVALWSCGGILAICIVRSGARADQWLDGHG